MSMPQRKGDWTVLHVSGRCGSPADGIEKGVESVGIIEASRFRQGDLLNDLAPGSISQMTCNSSPRASSSTEDRVMRCWGPLPTPSAGGRAACFWQPP